MLVAIPLYPGFTTLDAVGPATVLAFAPGWEVVLVAGQHGPVADDRRLLGLTATRTYEEVPHPDVVLVPGGPGTLEALGDTALLDWIGQAHTTARWTGSVCSGSFLLAAAGVLTGRRATSHWGWIDRLSQLGAVPVRERVVVDGSLITAAGVSAGIDMALTLLAAHDGDDAARTVQLAIEYSPEPPFDSGSPTTAPPHLHDAALGLVHAGVL